MIASQKAKVKAKKKKVIGKAKKRISSDDDFEPLKVSRRVRSRSRLTVRSNLVYGVFSDVMVAICGKCMVRSFPALNVDCKCFFHDLIGSLFYAPISRVPASVMYK